MPFRRMMEEAGEETEGHGRRILPKSDRDAADAPDTEAETETEGHARRFPKSDETVDGADDGQTEGHTYKLDPKARPGQRGGGATPDAAPTTRGWKRPSESGRAGTDS